MAILRLRKRWLRSDAAELAARSSDARGGRGAAQSIHQNVDETPRARLPAHVRIPVADSDQGTQQVGRIDILAHIAAGDGALHERGNRTCYQFDRGCMKGGAASCRSSQRW